MRKRLAGLACGLTMGLAPHAMAEPLDLIIRGGTVYDGTGAPGRPADVAVRGGRIVAVGRIDEPAREVVDARGLAVAPGFIDPHTHAPEALRELSGPFLNEQYLTQGVTTILAGPDGGFGPDILRLMMGMLAQRGSGTNYGCYVGHNGVRETVMGRARRAPDPAELEKMKALVREGMQMGCVGLSTGLMYEPGMYSETAEVVALAREVAPFDGVYDTHTRDPGFRLYESEKEGIDIGAAAGVPVKLAHEKATGLINKGKIGEIIGLVEAARARGQDVFADQYPYDGATTRLLKELLAFPGERAVGPDVDLAALQARLETAVAKPEGRAAVKQASEGGDGFGWIKAVGYGNMRIVDGRGARELDDQNLELLARTRDQTPFDLLVDLILQGHGNVLVTMGTVDEADIRALMVRPWVMISSDGAYIRPGATRGHPRSTGSFTRVLGRYSRDVGLISLPEAIRRMTSLTADHHRLYDRGRLAPGQVADITIFDPRTVRDRSTYAEPSLLSEGIVHVIVNGEFALRGGKVTGATLGRFVPRQAREAGGQGARP